MLDEATSRDRVRVGRHCRLNYHNATRVCVKIRGSILDLRSNCRNLLVVSVSNRLFVLEMGNSDPSKQNLSIVCQSFSRNLVVALSGFNDTLAVIDIRLGVEYYHYDASSRALSYAAMYILLFTSFLRLFDH